MKKQVQGWSERAGSSYWGGDRLDRMLATKDLENEGGALPLLEYVDLSTIQRIADVGSGIGRRHKYFPDAHYVGIEREEIMVENGRRVFPHLEFHLADAQELETALPQFKGDFDMVLTFHVLQYNHVQQQEEILNGIRFILKPGGFFYMKENTIYEHNNIGYTDMEDVRSLNNSSYTAAGWKHKLGRHGFSCITEADHGHFLFRKE